MAISRFSYANVRVMDLQKAITHYTDTVGLRLVESDDQRAYFQADECQDHHCVITTLSDRAGIDHVGFKVNDPSDLVEAAEAASAHGLAVRDVPLGEIAGQGPGVMITLPSEHNMLLFYHADKIGYAGGIIASIAIFTLGGLFAGLGGYWGTALAVFFVVIPVMCAERVEILSFIPAWFVGAGVFFAFAGMHEAGTMAQYMEIAVPEMIACVVGLCYGYCTVSFRTCYEKKVMPAAADQEPAEV